MLPLLQWLLIWILLVVAIFALVKGMWSSGASSAERRQEKSALDILKARYARGEIEREEFEQKKRDLSI